MKLPRDLSGNQLISVLKRLGYKQTSQTGSHVRMTILSPRQAHLTVPLLRPIPPGTLAAILKDAAVHMETTVGEILMRVS